MTVVALFGCSDKASPDDVAVVTTVPEGSLVDNDLESRRDTLLETRRALALQRAELDETRQELTAGGKDTAGLEQKEQVLAKREREVQTEFFALNDEMLSKLEQQSATLAQMRGKLGSDARANVRESAVANRETAVAKRERELATRETALAARDVASAKAWKESCSSGPVFSLPAPTPGTTYKKRDVDKQLRKASATMNKRGILDSDLPGYLRDAKKTATREMRKGEYGNAAFAAEQLARGVEGLKINKAFVQAKFGRVNSRVKGKLSDRDADALGKITADFGDGRYSSANRRLNNLIGRL